MVINYTEINENCAFSHYYAALTIPTQCDKHNCTLTNYSTPHNCLSLHSWVKKGAQIMCVDLVNSMHHQQMTRRIYRH
jgi:hypothetical protein